MPNPNANAAAANFGIVRQAVNYAVNKYGVGHRLANDARDDLAGDVMAILLAPRGAANRAPVDGYDPAKGSFLNYLGMIAKRAAQDEIEKMLRRSHASLDATTNGEDDEESDPMIASISSDAMDAEEQMVDAEQRMALAAACKSLGCEEYLDPDYDHEEYAKAHGISVGAARIRLCRTIDALQELVKKK